MRYIMGQLPLALVLAVAAMGVRVGIDDKIADLLKQHSPLLSYPTNLTQGMP